MQTQQSNNKYILPSSTVKAMGIRLQSRKNTYIHTDSTHLVETGPKSSTGEERPLQEQINTLTEIRC